MNDIINVIMNRVIETIDMMVRIILIIISGTFVYLAFGAALFGALTYVVPHTGIIIALTLVMIIGLFLISGMMKFFGFLMTYHPRYLVYPICFPT